jgi:hypothetical protein
MKLAKLRKHMSLLVLGVLTLAALVWLAVDLGSVTTDEAERRKKNLFPAWRYDDVTRIVVALPTERYELERKGEPGQGRTWDLVVEGARLSADEQVVDRLLATLDYARFERQVPPEAIDRAGFGLDAPRITIAVQMGSLAFDLGVGGETPAGDGAYVEVKGRGVYVVGKALVAGLAVKSAELRGREFVPYFSTDLAAIGLEGEGGTRRFERGEWSGGRGSGFRFAEGSEGPVGKRVDATRLDQVFVAMGRMQAQAFLDEPQAQEASEPRVSLTLTPREGTPSVLVLGGACPGKKGLVVAVRSQPSPLAVCVPEGVMAALTRPAADFVDDGVLGSTADEISEVRIERAGKVLDLARAELGFRLREPETREVSAETGNAFVEGLVAAGGKLAPDDAEFGEGERTKVRVVSVGGLTPDGRTAERKEEIEIGPAKDGGFLALRKEDGAKLLIGDVAAGAFTSSDLVLRDPTVLALRADDVELLTVEEAGRVQRVERDGGDFRLLEPKGKGLEADGSFAADAMASLAKLTAVRWVAAEADASFGLAEPRVRAVARLAEGAGGDPKGREIAVRIGAVTDDGAYAQIEGKREVFIAPKRFVDTLRRSFVSRSAFHVAPEVLSEIEIARGDKTLKLVRDGKQLRAQGGGTAQAAEVQEALSKLFPMTAVSVGPPPEAQGFSKPTLTIRMTFRKSPDDPPDAPAHATITVGAAETWDEVPTYYARRDGIDATYAVPQQPVKKLDAALGR